ncbi:CAF17-like 4Fe-4S cluster assembly/insertion protein YgfZ [Acetobacter thailandicus]|uniref:CAF17-like 4Fe-4S cluster assembly/insertion protein YgfZ n=1 Tax=Acetobacter thailandicus TaxID=1502842 RepID=UPI001BA8C460|nr:folate-binding protein YgfZ [Acetobacter thailandicus]MBS0959333.1 folate-binding protein YgfZ [Acetobacter thailandicus]
MSSATPSHLVRLTGRTVIKVSGPDRIKLLQGLITADLTTLSPETPALWSAILTPQGRWQADFFVIQDPDDTCLLLDCAATQAEDLKKQLSRFKLRSDVQLELTGLTVCAAWGSRPAADIAENAIIFADPRRAEAGWRLIDTPPEPAETATESDYNLHRLVLGLPDGVQDCEQGRTLAAEANMDLLGALSWTKGCYMGQEVTARMHYRTLLKRRLVPVAATHPLPAPGTPVFAGEAEVGTMRSSQDHIGLALLKVSALEQPLTCDGITLTPRPTEWLKPAIDALSSSENSQP